MVVTRYRRQRLSYSNINTVTDRKQDIDPQVIHGGAMSVEVSPLFHVGRLRGCVLYPATRTHFAIDAARVGRI